MKKFYRAIMKKRWIRLTLWGFLGAIIIAGCATTEGIINIAAESPIATYISPKNADGIQDELFFPLSVIPGIKQVLRGYTFTVNNDKGEVVFSDERENPVPKWFQIKKKKLPGIDIPADIHWAGTGLDGNYGPDGRYSYYFEAWDGMGNHGYSPTLFVFVDNTPPSLELTADYTVFSPDNDGRRDQISIAHKKATKEQEWIGRIDNSSGQIIARYSWKNVPQELVWKGTDLAGTVVVDGEYSYTVSSKDLAGNTAAFILDGITVDTKPTLISLDTDFSAFSPNGDGAKDTLTFTPHILSTANIVEWKLEVIDQNNRSQRLFKNGQTVPNTITFDGLNNAGARMPDGVYQGHLQVLYKNGNDPVALSMPFTLDTDPPKVVSLKTDFLVFSPDGDGKKDALLIRQKTSPEQLWEGSVLNSSGNKIMQRFWYGSTLDFMWEGRDNFGAIQPDGTYVYRLTSTDAAGNSTASVIDGITIDKRPTATSISTQHPAFSPNKDGVKDTIAIIPKLTLSEGIESWSVYIQNETGTAVKTFSGSGYPPPGIDFNGMGESGRMIPDVLYM